MIDLYCVKPIDGLLASRRRYSGLSIVVTVEDHHPEGGIGEAVRSALAAPAIAVHSLAVRKVPRSGKPVPSFSITRRYRAAPS